MSIFVSKCNKTQYLANSYTEFQIRHLSCLLFTDGIYCLNPFLYACILTFDRIAVVP